MLRTGWRLGTAATMLAGLAASMAVAGVPAGAAAAAGAKAAAGAAAPGGPEVRLIAAQANLTVGSYGGQVFLDPGIWVASLGSALQLDLQRADYSSPLTVTQVISQPGGSTTQIPWPSSVVGAVPSGLVNFIHLTVRNARGKAVASGQLDFCPDSYDPERAVADSPASSPYPQTCVADPFPKSLVWGISRGWAVDPAESSGGSSLQLAPGRYTVTENITPRYTRLLGISARDSTASAHVRVVKGAAGGPAPVLGGPAKRPAGRPLAALPRVRTLADPPASALPDLVPLPSWGISTQHQGKTRKHPLVNLLNFGATVWVGNAPLDVEGFRSGGSPVMPAYQYFWRSGQVIGRVRAGTMGFDNKQGHDHWHFEQFAGYRLLNANRKLVLRSHKVGFCIAPTDPVDLMPPTSVWQPSFLGFGGQCGSPTALWVQELMPPGWGDTYFQSVAGQSFNITNLPNGTYYIEVTANPERVLHETTTSNDTSYRRVILGGTRNHRTVRVPAWNGLDPEG
jgi:Lysyl oxidase